MARGYTSRKLEVWSLHAHRDGVAVDYRQMFEALAALPPEGRVWTTADRLVAIPTVEVSDSKVFFTAYEGAPDDRPVILNIAAGTERDAEVARGEMVATRTHAIVDLASREAIVEYNHRGAKAVDIATVIGVAGRRLPGWYGLWVELNPKVEEGFVEAINEFERIRVAQMKIARPNQDWEEWRDTLSGVADDSGAQNVSAEMTAGRGRSLEKYRGVVRFIKDRVRDPVSGIKSAAVVGTRPHETAETRVTTKDHKTHQRVSVRLTDAGQVDAGDIRRRLMEYDSARAEAREP